VIGIRSMAKTTSSEGGVRVQAAKEEIIRMMPNHFIVGSLLSVLLLSTTPSSYATEAGGSKIKERLAAVMKSSRVDPNTFGIHVESLADGRALFSMNENKAFNPASSIKLLIAATSLSQLGPNYRFATKIAQKGNDLCLIGGGDPSLVNETLWILAQEMKRREVAEIKGDLFVDTSLFETSKDLSASFRGDEDRAFTAPISSLSANFNAVTIHAYPTQIGKPPRIEIDPNLDVFDVRNRARTVESAGKRDLGASIEGKTDKAGTKLRIEVNGKVSARQAQTTIYRAVPEPELYTAAILVSLLKKSGGNFNGKIRHEKCPADAQEIFSFESKPLSQVVFDMNKFSNNFIAEMLLHAVGGLDSIREWLKKSGIPAPELKMENASGLSRNTRVSAKTLTDVLRAAASDFSVGPEFITSLGIMGVDGTLRRRLRDSSCQAKVRAKSGQLNDSVSLTGYADSAEWGRVAFSFLFNSENEESFRLQKIEEKLLETIVAPIEQ
jgi:serine-type D-Ala-D-Ala carboxypeptidase/endopeptidase (penicillin-binding protein 4)